MKDRKNKLLWVDRLRVTAVMVIAFCSLLRAGRSKAVFLVIELIVFALFLLAEFTMNRCPHCDRYLGRNRGQFCQHCGARIREDRPDT